mmetsp:Transcript_1808/g.5773  ORF Transcript_1808/g.5773 Transcript_1808/m.5773 type:complete len:491 (-) Transcript_1808:51-1523(-)
MAESLRDKNMQIEIRKRFWKLQRACEDNFPALYCDRCAPLLDLRTPTAPPDSSLSSSLSVSISSSGSLSSSSGSSTSPWDQKREARAEHRREALSFLVLFDGAAPHGDLATLVYHWDATHNSDLAKCLGHCCTTAGVSMAGTTSSASFAVRSAPTLTSSRDGDSSGDSSRRGTKRSQDGPLAPDQASPIVSKKARGPDDDKVHWSTNIRPPVAPAAGPCSFHKEMARRHPTHPAAGLCRYSKEAAQELEGDIWKAWTDRKNHHGLVLDSDALARLVCFMKHNPGPYMVGKGPKFAKQPSIFQIYATTYATPNGVDKQCAYEAFVTSQLDKFKEDPDVPDKNPKIHHKVHSAMQRFPDYHKLLISPDGPEKPPGLGRDDERYNVAAAQKHSAAIVNFWVAAGHTLYGGTPCRSAPPTVQSSGPMDPFAGLGLVVPGPVDPFASVPVAQLELPSSKPPNKSRRVFKLRHRKPGMVLVRKRRRTPRPTVAAVA